MNTGAYVMIAISGESFTESSSKSNVVFWETYNARREQVRIRRIHSGVWKWFACGVGVLVASAAIILDKDSRMTLSMREPLYLLLVRIL